MLRPQCRIPSHGCGNMDCWQQTGHVMFVEMVATRFETVRGRMDVGGDARIIIARRMWRKTDKGSDHLLEKANFDEFSNCIHIKVLYIKF